MTTQVWFETHSTTLDNENARATGWWPGELSARGRNRATSLGVRIGDREPAAIFSSDLERAVQTVRIACQHLDKHPEHLPVFLDWRLRECNYGELNGADHTQVHGRRMRYLIDPYPGGESWTEAIDRARSGVLDAVGRFRGQTIVIVGHIATRLAVQQLADGTATDELISTTSTWQPGWLVEIDT